MFGFSKIQLGLLIGAGLLVASLAVYAKYATEKIGQAKAEAAALEAGLRRQVASNAKLRQGIERADELVAQLQRDNAELEQQKQRVKTVVRKVLVDDPEAAECGNAPLPESIARVVRDYSGGDGGDGVPDTAPEPVSDGA